MDSSLEKSQNLGIIHDVKMLFISEKTPKK